MRSRACVAGGSGATRDAIQLLLHLQASRRLTKAELSSARASCVLTAAAPAILGDGPLEAFQRPLVSPLPARDAPVERLDVAAAQEIVGLAQRLLGVAQDGEGIGSLPFWKASQLRVICMMAAICA